MAEKLEFDLSVSNNQLKKAIDESSKAASSLEGILSTAIGVFAGNVATKAIDSFVGGINSLISVGKEAVDAAAQQEVAVNNLNNALARSGNFSKQASKDLQDFAAQIQATTIYEDDAVLSTAAYIESLTNLSSGGLKQATIAAANLATVLGIDLQSAGTLLSKAIEGNTAGLGRYGIEVKKGATEAQTLSNVIEALNNKFGGAATGQINTYAGSVIALKNSYGEVLESAGNVIVQNPLVVGAINSLKNIFTETSGEVQRLNPEIQSLLNDGFFALSAASQVLLDALDGITVVLKIIGNSFAATAAIILDTFIGPLEVVIDGMIALGSLIPGVGDSFDGLENPIKGASESLKQLRDEGIQGILDAANGNIFRSLSGGVENFTNSTIENSEKVLSATVTNNQGRINSEKETSAQVLAAREQLNAEILLLQTQLANEEATFKANQAALSIENEFAANEIRIQAIYDQKVKEAEAVYQGELLKNKSIADAQQQQLANDKAYQQLYLNTKKAFDEKETASKKNTNDQKKKIDEDYKKAYSDTLSTIATLSGEGNKTLAAIGKAAALTQIAISTPVAVAKAFELGPLLGPPAAAVVAAAMAAQAAKVVGIKFEDGGFVGGMNGGTNGADNRIAQVRDGEMILNASQQRNLLDMINSGSSGGDIVVQVDGREIARAVKMQIQSGYRLA